MKTKNGYFDADHYVEEYMQYIQPDNNLHILSLLNNLEFLAKQDGRNDLFFYPYNNNSLEGIQNDNGNS